MAIGINDLNAGKPVIQEDFTSANESHNCSSDAFRRHAHVLEYGY